MTRIDQSPPQELPDEQSTNGERPFRDRALGGAPNPLERIDHLFHQTSKRIWLGTLGLALLLVAGVLWTVIAKQSITSEGPAVIVPPTGLFDAARLEAGTVASVLVREGEVVSRGQPLAKLQPAGATRTVDLRSPVAGRVLTVEVRAGDNSPAGTRMFRLAPLNVRPMAIALFPAATISQLAAGQDVAVQVNGVSPERYGRAIGRVAYIGPVPITDRRLEQLTGDPSFATVARTAGELREVRIRLERADTPSGLAWTHGQGPAGPLPVGVRAVAVVTISRETLISKAFG
jgi:multidrug efflux pump subunit AcrA (membrane-fusion protein)